MKSFSMRTMLLPICLALAFYLAAIAISVLFSVATAFGRAGGAIDPIGCLYWALPVIFVHAAVMWTYGRIPLGISTLFISGIYYWYTRSRFNDLMLHVHPEYIRVFGHQPPFDAQRWLALSSIIPTICLSIGCLLLLFPPPKHDY